MAVAASPGRRPPAPALIGAGLVAVAGLTLLLPSTAGYDPWAWLVWGREVAALDLDTTAGPAWKPLPVLITTLLAPLGDAAPGAWLVVARAGALAAVVLAGLLARRLAGGGRAGVLAAAAAAAVLVCVSGFARGAWLGFSEGLLVAALLGAMWLHLAGRRGPATAALVAAALLRPEAWLLAVAYGAWWAWRRHGRRGLVLAAAGALVVLACWLLPDLWGSGDLGRSGARARVAEPGQPALAGRPVLASLGGLAAMASWPVLLLAAAASVRVRRARPLALLGAGWAVVVALMAEAGFSGEQRYHMPAAAAAAVLAGVGVGAGARRLAARAGRAPVAAAAGALGAAALVLIAPAGRALAGDLAYDARLHGDLARAVAAAGGGERVRACGPLAAGRARFPVLAWHVGAPISAVSLVPRPGGVVFRSRLRAALDPAPVVRPGTPLVARAGTWEVYAACAPGR